MVGGGRYRGPDLRKIGHRLLHLEKGSGISLTDAIARDGFGRFRLPLITRAASAFRLCGDWSQGIARIRCPECGFDRFRPFSCKSCLLCPSCAQKRTLLLGEYLSEDLLLRCEISFVPSKALRNVKKKDIWVLDKRSCI
jgi:hypothetical protein